MTMWVGVTCKCHWSYAAGPKDAATEISHSEWDMLVRNIESLLSADKGDGTILIANYRTALPGAAMRKQLLEMMARYPGSVARIHASAVISSSPLVRGVVQATDWMMKKPYPEKIFSKPSLARAWLKTMSPGFDPEALRRAMASAIRIDYLWDE